MARSPSFVNMASSRVKGKMKRMQRALRKSSKLRITIVWAADHRRDDDDDVQLLLSTIALFFSFR